MERILGYAFDGAGTVCIGESYRNSNTQSVNDRKMSCRASGTLKTLIAKLMEDEQDYMIAGMLRTLAALDEINVKR